MQPNTTAPAPAPATYQAKVAALKPVLNDLFPTPEKVAKFIALALRAATPLQLCSPQSVQLAIIDVAALDLDPTPAAREVYLVPYGKDCQLIIAPGGWLTLFGRAGWSISYGVVYDNELDNFRVTLGSDPRIDFTPQPRKQGQIIWAYAVASRAGYKDVVKVIGPDEIEHAKKFAKSLNVWKEHPARMAEKTVLKLLAKSLPKLGDAPVLQQAAYIQDVYESREKRVRDVRTEFGDAAVEAVGAEIVEVEAALEPVDTLDAAYAQIDAAQTPEAVRAVLTAHPQHADDVQLKIYATKRIDALKGAQK